MIADLRGCGTSQQQEANAGFIVKAVNAHDDLLRLVRALLFSFDHIGYRDTESEAWWEGQYEPGTTSDEVRRAVWHEAKAYVGLLAIQSAPHVSCDVCDATETLGGEINEKTLEGDGWYFGPAHTLCPAHNDEGEVA